MRNIYSAPTGKQEEKLCKIRKSNYKKQLLLFNVTETSTGRYKINSHLKSLIANKCQNIKISNLFTGEKKIKFQLRRSNI